MFKTPLENHTRRQECTELQAIFHAPYVHRRQSLELDAIVSASMSKQSIRACVNSISKSKRANPFR